MLAGPIFQIIYFYFIINFLTSSEVNLFKTYHYSILLFNLLPIYPLDGGKFFNIVLNYFLSFRDGFRVTFYLSYICISIIVVFLMVKQISVSLSLLLVIILVICKLTSEFKKEKFYYNKFLLERYLNDYKFHKIKVIKGIAGMSRDYKHVIFKDGKTKTEKEELSSYFRH